MVVAQALVDQGGTRFWSEKADVSVGTCENVVIANVSTLAVRASWYLPRSDLQIASHQSGDVWYPGPQAA